MHNVHAIPYHNKEFNFAQLPGAPITLKSFNEGGDLVRIKSDVHPWMFAYIGVVRNPWFAVSDTNGFYQIPHNLPAGRYQITARHLKAGIQTQEIIVEKGQPAIANFRFTVPGTATPQTTEVARESR